MNLVPEHKKGRQLRVVGGSKYPVGTKGWVNLSRGDHGYTAKSIYIIYVDGSGNEREATNCIRKTSVKYVEWRPSATSAANNEVQRIADLKKGRQLCVVGGSKFPAGTKGWVNLSRGDFGYTPKSVYIIYVDGGGNEREAQNCIRASSVEYVDWCPVATAPMRNQVQRVPDHKKGRQLRVVGGSKYPGRKGWVNLSRGVNGHTSQSVYIIYVDGGGNEREAPNCMRATSVKYVDWEPEQQADSVQNVGEIDRSPDRKDEIIRQLLEANHQLEKALRDEKDNVRRLEEMVQTNMQRASGSRMYIKKENKVKKEKMTRARLAR